MPSRSHLSSYVPGFELEESSSAIEGFPNSRVSSTTYTRNAPVKPAAELSRPLKRRRTAGLNTRYDNMIEQVNMMYSSPGSASESRRKRTFSSGSSSVSTRDVPKTPLDAYSRFQEGRLGKDFAVIKLTEPTRELRDDTEPSSDTVDEVGVRAKTPGPIPDWLSSTLSRLDSRHPLRRVMPAVDSPFNPEVGNDPVFPAKESGDDTPGQPDAEEDTVFAFQPPPPEVYNVPFWTDVSPQQDLEAASSDTLFAPESAADSRTAFLEPALPIYRSSSVTSSRALQTPFDSVAQDDMYAMSPRFAVPFSTPGPGKTALARTKASEVPLSPMDASTLARPYSPDLADASPTLLHDETNSHPANSRPSPEFSPVNSRHYHNDSFGKRHGFPATSNEVTSAFGSYNDAMLWEPQAGDYLGEANVFSRSRSPGERRHSNIALVGDQASFQTVRDPRTADRDQVLDAISSPSYVPRFPSIDHILKQKEIDNIFSTPGPTYRAYFDSPTEDPSSSPPSSPHIYPLDENLDFQWTPFLQGNRSEGGHRQHGRAVSQTNFQHSGYDVDFAVDRLDAAQIPPVHQEQPEKQAHIYEYPLARDSPSGPLEPSADAALDDWEIRTRARMSMAHRTPVDEELQPTQTEQISQESEEPIFAFAPAPGIFVSPLRDGQTESTSDTQSDLHHNSVGQDSEEKRDAEVPLENPTAQMTTSNEQACHLFDSTCTMLPGTYRRPADIGDPPKTPVKDPSKRVATEMPISMLNARLLGLGRRKSVEDEESERDSIESWPG
ncbi:hypothetical protein EVG20_g2123 [Dentipellis fragilis]|uniref:Uncharacterized protein n=1 Tax=Dentipellis fragilis TaxID=205917 RepID=A0A4Y9Z8M6_9AGAM|nr:hypothetical protein EVG20_g2123 [Dentipellis fragilis]